MGPLIQPSHLGVRQPWDMISQQAGAIFHLGVARSRGSSPLPTTNLRDIDPLNTEPVTGLPREADSGQVISKAQQQATRLKIIPTTHLTIKANTLNSKPANHRLLILHIHLLTIHSIEKSHRLLSFMNLLASALFPLPLLFPGLFLADGVGDSKYLHVTPRSSLTEVDD